MNRASLYILSSISGSAIGGSVVNIVVARDFSFGTLYIWAGVILAAAMSYFGWVNLELDKKTLTPRDVYHSLKILGISFISSAVVIISLKETILFFFMSVFGEIISKYSKGIQILIFSQIGILITGAFAIYDIVHGKIKSETAKDYYKEGNYFIQHNRFDLAVDCYRKAIFLDNDNPPEFFERLGNNILNMGYPDVAKKCFEKANSRFG